MSKFKKLLSIIEIKKAFIITAFILIALGFLEQFFLLFVCVTVHEAAHVILAARFGIKTSRITITALGETSIMDGIEGLDLFSKIAVVMIGPLVNLCIGIISMAAGEDSFAAVNFSIAFFNLIPVYPLDGGRLLRYILGEITGVINSYKISGKAARHISKLIIVIGFVQITLYPYNISLICIGLYLISVNKQFPMGVYEFYKLKLDSLKQQKLPARQIRRAALLAVSPEVKLSTIICRLSISRFYFFAITSEGEAAFLRDELQLLKYISNQGLNKTFGEFCADTLCKQVE